MVTTFCFQHLNIRCVLIPILTYLTIVLKIYFEKSLLICVCDRKTTPGRLVAFHALLLIRLFRRLHGSLGAKKKKSWFIVLKAKKHSRYGTSITPPNAGSKSHPRRCEIKGPPNLTILNHYFGAVPHSCASHLRSSPIASTEQIPTLWHLILDKYFFRTLPTKNSEPNYSSPHWVKQLCHSHVRVLLILVLLRVKRVTNSYTLELLP